MSLPLGPLVAWYGDDFTGASAVMEVLTFAGFPSVLFFDVPDAAMLTRFGDLRGIGIAGDARTRSPEWMDAHLPPVFAALRATGAPVVHYKICSTLDSSPTVGSIGRAADLALAPDETAPLVVAAPAIGRWQAFGNLFAVAAGAVHRLDRHPTMSVHPVTPMDEADVTRHLGRQTARSVGLVDLLALKSGRGAEGYARARADGAAIVAIDVVDEETLAAAGQIVWGAAPVFAIGSQGIEYALVAAWRAAGFAPQATPRKAGPAGRVAVVSGSVSPVTAAQVVAAAEAGFALVPFDAAAVVDERAREAERERAVAAALGALRSGRDPLVHSARGPGDPAVIRFREAVAAAGLDPAAANAAVGTTLGRVLNEVARTAKLRRVAIAGGDTSSAAARGLGIAAVTAEAVLAPGAPLLVGHGDDPATDGIELALKGGQMGPENFFIALRDGIAAAEAPVMRAAAGGRKGSQ